MRMDGMTSIVATNYIAIERNHLKHSFLIVVKEIILLRNECCNSDIATGTNSMKKSRTDILLLEDTIYTAYNLVTLVKAHIYISAFL